MNNIEEGKQFIDRLEKEHGLPKAEMAALIDANCPELRDYAKIKARAIGDRKYGKNIYIRGLIEFTAHSAAGFIVTGDNGLSDNPSQRS